jgi:hypothetical protein
VGVVFIHSEYDTIFAILFFRNRLQTAADHSLRNSNVDDNDLHFHRRESLKVQIHFQSLAVVTCQFSLQSMFTRRTALAPILQYRRQMCLLLLTAYWLLLRGGIVQSVSCTDTIF